MNYIKYSDEDTGADAKLFEDGTLFICGTGEDQDVIQDIKFWPTLKQKVKGHKGSKEQADFLYEAVDWSKVKVVYGHSLGGSVALWLSLKVSQPIKTYGAFRPFVFWQRFPKSKNITNYIYHTDAVPRIFLFRKYRGEVIRIKGKGFHPFTDHLRYEDLNKYVGYMKELL